MERLERAGRPLQEGERVSTAQHGMLEQMNPLIYCSLVFGSLVSFFQFFNRMVFLVMFLVFGTST